MKLALALIAIGLPAVANAAPVYLECTLTDGNRDLAWNVTLDEERAAVDYVIPSINVAQKAKAIFTPEKVMFNGMEISRVDLTITRKPILEGGRTDKGQCRIPAPVKRAF